jgi:hypothetical protein
MCCENPQCLSFVHGIAPGCDKTAPEDPDAVCCWIKTASTQLTVPAPFNISVKTAETSAIRVS